MTGKVFMRKNKTFFLQKDKTSVRKPSKKDNEELADLMCKDIVLRSEFEIKDNDMPTGTDFSEKLKRWCDRNNSISMSIINENDQAIGLISLRHIFRNDRNAKIGYWLGSSYRKKGYTSQAFGLVIDLAHKLQLSCVSSTVLKNNVASQKIWEKYGATKREKDESKFIFSISLK
jgi:ribosomal-protein-alanine N-acetyltransferase